MVDKEYIEKMKRYDIRTLPLYLQISIKDYIKVCEENNLLRMGDYYTDLMSSINCAQWDEELPMNIIDELRDLFQ